MIEQHLPSFIEDDDPRDPQIDAYDAVPRDGPGIFIAHSNGLEEDHLIEGRWVDLRQILAAHEVTLQRTKTCRGVQRPRPRHQAGPR